MFPQNKASAEYGGLSKCRTRFIRMGTKNKNKGGNTQLPKAISNKEANLESNELLNRL